MNKNLHFYILLFLVTTCNVLGQNIPDMFGARASALGNAASTHNGAFSVFSNQAGLASTSSVMAGVYGENRFLATDIRLLGAAATLPTKSGTFGLGASYYGVESYGLMRGTLGYGRYLYEKLAIGAEFDFLSLNIDGYGSNSAVTFGVGLQYDINDKISLGAHIFNPLSISFTGQEIDRITSTFKMGLSYVPSEQVGIYLETAKSWHFPASFRGGIEYYLIKQVVLRGGFSTIPSRIIDGRFSADLATATFGIGLDLKNIQVDFANRFHPVLGHSPMVTLLFKSSKVVERKVKEVIE